MSIDVKGLRVFLSGPMTGYPDWNRAAFDEAERRCLERGALSVYNPARGAPAEGEEAMPHEGYMLGTLHELTDWAWGLDEETAGAKRMPRYDVLLLLDGWERSDGAMAEFKAAVACGILAVALEGDGMGECEHD